MSTEVGEGGTEEVTTDEVWRTLGIHPGSVLAHQTKRRGTARADGAGRGRERIARQSLHRVEIPRQRGARPSGEGSEGGPMTIARYVAAMTLAFACLGA